MSKPWEQREHMERWWQMRDIIKFWKLGSRWTSGCWRNRPEEGSQREASRFCTMSSWKCSGDSLLWRMGQVAQTRGVRGTCLKEQLDTRSHSAKGQFTLQKLEQRGSRMLCAAGAGPRAKQGVHWKSVSETAEALVLRPHTQLPESWHRPHPWSGDWEDFSLGMLNRAGKKTYRYWQLGGLHGKRQLTTLSRHRGAHRALPCRLNFPAGVQCLHS